MTTVDLTNFEEDGFVLHFRISEDKIGDNVHKVDAAVLGKTLVSIAAAIRSVGREMYPKFRCEVVVKSVGPGSFRVRLGIEQISAKDWVLGLSSSVIASVISGIIVYHVTTPNSDVSTYRDGDATILEYEHEKTYQDGSLEKERTTMKLNMPIENPENVDIITKASKAKRHIDSAIKAMNSEPSIEEFGICRGLNDELPALTVPRSSFPSIIEDPEQSQDEEEETVFERVIEDNAEAIVHLAVFERSDHEWEFVWNGVNISASISDSDFFDKLEKGEIAIRHGDVFSAKLKIHQKRKGHDGIWMNHKYEIVELRLISSQQTIGSPNDENGRLI